MPDDNTGTGTSTGTDDQQGQGDQGKGQQQTGKTYSKQELRRDNAGVGAASRAGPTGGPHPGPLTPAIESKGSSSLPQGVIPCQTSP